MVAIKDELRLRLTNAMKTRDRLAMTTYRNVLSVLDNASAVPMRAEHRAGAVETSKVGIGSADVARRELTEAEEIALLQREVRTFHEDALRLDAAKPESGAPSRAEAALLQDVVARVQ